MFKTGLQYEKTITMITEQCCNCGVVFGMPSDLRDRFMNDPEKSFYCPNGHGQHYRYSKEQRLRQDAERKLRDKENELAQAVASKIQVEQQLKKASAKLKRVEKGVCPCCNRTFSNLQRHMQTKHPNTINQQ